MKDFFKFTLATVTGIIVTSIIMGFIGIIVIAGMLSTSDAETVVRKNSVMVLNFNGSLSERYEENPIRKYLGLDDTGYGLDDVLASIKKAKENENIKGIYIQANSLGAGFASLQEIRNALVDFKTSGKFIVSYGDYYTQGLYYLSSVADKVILNPEGKLDWHGLSSQPIFYTDLLKKLGIEMQIFKVGTYKSAVEPYINHKMSDANREQVTEYISALWGQFVGDVSESRGVSTSDLNALADRMIMLYPASESVRSGMIDTLMYKNDMRDYLKTMVDIKKDDKLNLLGMSQMINVKKNTPKDKSGNIVAVYYAYGTIDSNASSMDEAIVGNKVIRDLRKLKEDKNVKAVVLRVNSPGGSAFDSEQIWHAVNELKKEKPVIVSMGDYAASGGYYISCGADYIVAEPTTLTGSIGIFGMFPNMEELLTDKLGLDFDVVKTNKFSDFGSVNRPMNNDEQALMQMMVNNGYDLFLTRCAEGRNMTKEEIGRIAEGRVWAGGKAKELGLVDELGGIDRALEIAIERAEIEAYTVVSYPAKKDFLSSFLETTPGNYVESEVVKSNLGEYYKDFNLIKNIKQADVLQARMPFELNIK